MPVTPLSNMHMRRHDSLNCFLVTNDPAALLPAKTQHFPSELRRAALERPLYQSLIDLRSATVVDTGETGEMGLTPACACAFCPAGHAQLPAIGCQVPLSGESCCATPAANTCLQPS
jgi:hypothetical protein